VYLAKKQEPLAKKPYRDVENKVVIFKDEI
jgi:hypothetical protein